ncbi:MAG: alpha-amylase C-terminal beta-sheet domain-containing protein [Elusimicrobiaceae bacterium]|nr:alpha-amylase C-terminal beta-sheet domain-containing protein [Elusimicrobiaceae bacterium]
MNKIPILCMLCCMAVPAGAQDSRRALSQLNSASGHAAVAEPYAASVSSSSRFIRQPDDSTLPDHYNGGNLEPPAKPQFDAGSAIMLQGFHWYADSYWYHPAGGWWGELAGRAEEIGRMGFDLIWFPPAAVGSYYPSEWYNLNGQWGERERLEQAIQAMHSSGVKVLGDIVFNHRNGKTGWADFRNPDWPTTVIVKDDEWQGGPKSENYDQGQGDGGCRDIDHTKAIVQQDAVKYLVWLRRLGYDGWRYDMVKGFPGHYVGQYNAASNPAFSVGEFYDTNRQALANWADSTDSSAGKAAASSVFDFTTRYNIVNAAESGQFDVLNDGGRPSGFVGWWPAKAVTFVENHDTSPRDPNFIANAPESYKTQRMMGYAYILTHPGVPCVFWPHLFDWGESCKNKILKLVGIRKEAGITATSPVEIIKAEKNLYAAVITGRKRKIALKLGSSWDWSPGPGWTAVESGENYAIWAR